MVTREKFSATEFWDDCAKYKPTLFQYIGELCRYLLNTPPHPLERKSTICASPSATGCAPKSGRKFQDRFRIPHIMEFYGATEGNVGMINYDGKVGAIGRVPWYARTIQPIRLVRYDVEQQMPVRGADGFCRETADGEVGEAVGRINERVARERFEGYTQEGRHREEDPARRLRQGRCLVPHRRSDAARPPRLFLFRRPHRRHLPLEGRERLHQRSGRGAFGVLPGVKEANVYGVEVPGGEGKAGMAALVADAGFDLGGAAAHLEKNLPSYARPDIPALPERDRNHLHLQAAQDRFAERRLRSGGDRRSALSCAATTARYVPLTPELFRDIKNGRMKL